MIRVSSNIQYQVSASRPGVYELPHQLLTTKFLKNKMANVQEGVELNNLYFLKTWKFELELLWNYDNNERVTKKIAN